MAERVVDCYVAALPDGQREIAEAVRRLVRSLAPEAREAFKWAQPVFESGGALCLPQAFRSHVNFGFWRGVEVDAGRGVLETGGSKIAHVKLREVSDIDDVLLGEIVREAVRLDVLTREEIDRLEEAAPASSPIFGRRAAPRSNRYPGGGMEVAPAQPEA
jgi:hypothetical protein